MTTITEALLWAALAAVAMPVGALAALTLPFSHRSIAAIMSVGAGLLLGAIAFDLAAEALERLPSLQAAAAIGAGAILFSLINNWLASRGAQDRKRCGGCVAQPSESETPGSGNAIAMGQILDGIPEGAVLGATFVMHGIEPALLAAVLLGNVAGAVSGTAGMAAAGRPRTRIFLIWGGAAVSFMLSAVAGAALLVSAPPSVGLTFGAFAAGALLGMICEALLPEAFHLSPRYSGTLAALGFSGALLLASAM